MRQSAEGVPDIAGLIEGIRRVKSVGDLECAPGFLGLSRGRFRSDECPKLAHRPFLYMHSPFIEFGASIWACASASAAGG